MYIAALPCPDLPCPVPDKPGRPGNSGPPPGELPGGNAGALVSESASVGRRPRGPEGIEAPSLGPGGRTGDSKT